MSTQPKMPLAEVFGFPITNFTEKAIRYRKKRLCPFNNRVPSCTKDKANDPLGVCSIFEASQDRVAIVCPIRFREDWRIIDDAAAFFFEEAATWTTLSEVRLNDKDGKSAGNIDIVLVSYDENGHLLDFGALEVQAVYISGNIREPFKTYIKEQGRNHKLDWSHKGSCPKPDYLSSSRKRLVPQLIYKGSIFRAWQKKTAVALHKGFFETLPPLASAPPDKAEMAWMIYDLKHDATDNIFKLEKIDTIYTFFEPALIKITTPNPGAIEDFRQMLQEKLDEKLDALPPDAPTLGQILGE